VETYDVAIVGGGLAGLTAARELSLRDRRAILLEARDRLGGRTWVGSFDGVKIELGGAFVHWTQPHVWAELTRYGLGVDPVPEPEQAFALGSGGAVALDQRGVEAFPEAIRRYCEVGIPSLAGPMGGPIGDDLSELDRLSNRDRLEMLDLPEPQRDFLDALAAGLCSSPNDRSGFLGVAVTYALAGFDPSTLAEANGRWTIRGGTRALVDAIATDTTASLRLGEPVESIEQDADGVDLRTSDSALRARTAIVALPVNALGAIRFAPELSERKREAAKVGLVGQGAKLFAKLAPGYPSTSAHAPDRHPVTFVETAAATPDGGQVVVAFAHTAEGLFDDHAAAAPIERMLPGARVEELGGHDWTTDPFARETWAVYGPGTWTRWSGELDRTEGRVAFAGGDIARGWSGYIDGAIETGLRCAREAEAILR
jgi:phytoene dehydrogenase-like protein